jgi:hypothetical protein
VIPGTHTATISCSVSGPAAWNTTGRSSLVMWGVG